jgi:hypothetical protein
LVVIAAANSSIREMMSSADALARGKLRVSNALHTAVVLNNTIEKARS